MDLIEEAPQGDIEDYDFDNITPKYYFDEETTMETVCGTDNRIKQIDTSAMPYKAICKLYLKAANGGNFVGTGFLTHRNKLYTAGHCVYDHKSGGWMKSIIVVPAKSGPKEPFGRYKAAKMYATKEWVNNASTRYDMGAIKLTKDVKHSDVISVTTTDANEASVCGYPGDRDTGIFQYRMRDMVTKKNGRFYYQIDTFGGQSGAPLLTNAHTAIGIHNYGGCDNKASDLTNAFIDKIDTW